MAKRSAKKLLLIIVLLVIGAGLVGYYILYSFIYKNNVSLGGQKFTYIYIRTGATYKDVLDTLYERKIIINHLSFEQVAKKKKYPSMIHPGKYKITEGMSNNSLVNELRSGDQEPVKITFTSIRKKEDLAGKMGKALEPDSVHLLEAINDEDIESKYGFNGENILAMFIPNTYVMNWNTTPDEFMARMAKEYKAFWTDDRKEKAIALNMTQTQVIILASIVEKETPVDGDKPIIAGVYINRLKKNIPLEADPTLIWAANDFTIKRVLNVHKQIESPYNTYKHKGLPPGPIDIPSVSSIDAVLNYTKHEYLYFCAKEDLSGYSCFAKTLPEHMKNARRYQEELNKRRILK
jgi:UPF0755 protein